MDDNITVSSTTDAPETPAQEEVEQEESVSTEEVEETEQESPENSEEEEGLENEDDESEEDEPEGEKKSKKKSGFQKRINKLTKQRLAAEEKAQLLEQRLLRMESQLEQRQNPKPEKSENAFEGTTENGKPHPDQFDEYDEYIDALTDWKMDMRLAKKDQESQEAKQKSEFEKRMSTHMERVKEFAQTVNDWDEVMEEVADLNYSLAFQDIITSSENGPELMYEICKDVEEFERINSLSPMQMAREIGRLESKITKDDDSPKQKKKVTTKAPPPLKQKVSTKSSGSKKSIYDPDLTQAEYEKLRGEMLKSRA